MVHVNSMPVMEVLAKATNVISEGEVLQLMHEHDPDTSEATYMQIIYCKTAALFEVATQIGALINPVSEQEITAMAHYGRHLGMAFQLIDDVLDYQSTSETLGKNPGDDLADGKLTLPLLRALENSNDEERDFIRQAIKAGDIEAMPRILEIIASTQAIEYTYDIALKQAQLARQALEYIPTSPYRDALNELVDFCIQRTH